MNQNAFISPRVWRAVVLALFACAPTHADGRGTQQLVEITPATPGIRLDIRYATSHNFLGRPLYHEARAFLQRPVVAALLKAARSLRAEGYGIVVFDAYRPLSVTRRFWDALPPSKRAYVANPSRGSRHNRGCAVDITLFDLHTARQVAMPSNYDEMTARAHADYAGGTAIARRHRAILRHAMKSAGFTVNPREWWHFDYRGWRKYPVLNVPLERIQPGRV